MYFYSSHTPHEPGYRAQTISAFQFLFSASFGTNIKATDKLDVCAAAVFNEHCIAGRLKMPPSGRASPLSKGGSSRAFRGEGGNGIKIEPKYVWTLQKQMERVEEERLCLGDCATWPTPGSAIESASAD